MKYFSHEDIISMLKDLNIDFVDVQDRFDLSGSIVILPSKKFYYYIDGNLE